MPALSDLAFHVLLALASEPSHGYAIGKEVEAQSGGRLDPTTGTLYQVLQRLTADGLIVPAKAPRGTDERRKYFALSARGRQAAAPHARRLEPRVRGARHRQRFPGRV